MIVVLLLAAECELGALVEMVGVAFPWYVHHDEVLTKVIELVPASRS